MVNFLFRIILFVCYFNLHICLFSYIMESHQKTVKQRRHPNSAHRHMKLNQWSAEDMENAHQEYQNLLVAARGDKRLINLMAIARKYGIGVATLHDRISGKVKGVGHLSGGAH